MTRRKPEKEKETEFCSYQYPIMATEMTFELVRKLCKEKDLYRTPHLNDKLYLHFMGFEQISCLEEYVNIKSIFLEGNALQSLSGLSPHCGQLRCIFAQQNCLLSLDGIQGLEYLDTLNVSSNAIKTIQHLDTLPKLTSLQITHNRLASTDDIRNLIMCPTITVLDLSHNQIDDVNIGDVLFQLPVLACLYLQGNPVVSKIRHYRKTMIVNIRSLNYLDDRPVFPKERRLCDAWCVGGIEAERNERATIRDEELQKDKENFEYLKMIREKAMSMKTGLVINDEFGHDDDDDDGDEVDDSEDEDDFIEPIEPPELIAARLKLAAYPAKQNEEEPPELTQARIELETATSQDTSNNISGKLDNKEQISDIIDGFVNTAHDNSLIERNDCQIPDLEDID